jgi:hypothetical protein
MRESGFWAVIEVISRRLWLTRKPGGERDLRTPEFAAACRAI